jgi:hypothetical protein
MQVDLPPEYTQHMKDTCSLPEQKIPTYLIHLPEGRIPNEKLPLSGTFTCLLYPLNFVVTSG